MRRTIEIMCEAGFMIWVAFAAIIALLLMLMHVAFSSVKARAKDIDFNILSEKLLLEARIFRKNLAGR